MLVSKTYNKFEQVSFNNVNDAIYTCDPALTTDSFIKALI